MKRGKAKAKILKHIEKNPAGDTISQIATVMGISVQKADYNLKQLLNEGKIERIGWLYKPVTSKMAAEIKKAPEKVFEITEEGLEAVKEVVDIEKAMKEILAEIRKKKTYRVTLTIGVAEVEDV